MKTQEERRVRLQLERPIGLTLLWAVAFLAGILILVEVGARSQSVQRKVPFQAYGTNHTQFEVQLLMLAEYVEEKGPPECFIMGNSGSHRALDPDVLSHRYEELTGTGLECFNFSILGANVAITALITEMLIIEYDPKLIILGTSFTDYTERRERRVDERFLENPWLLHRLGDPSLEGWLLDKSYAFRLLTMFGYTIDPSTSQSELYDEALTAKTRITASGYARFWNIFEVWDPAEESVMNRLISELGGFSLSETNLSKLEVLTRLKTNGIEVMVIEIPYHHTLIEFLNESGGLRPERDAVLGFVMRANERIGEIANASGVTYWLTADLDLIPNDGWSDRNHLNTIGSAIFSGWLAEQIFIAIENGQIKDPLRQ